MGTSARMTGAYSDVALTPSASASSHLRIYESDCLPIWQRVSHIFCACFPSACLSLQACTCVSNHVNACASLCVSSECVCAHLHHVLVCKDHPFLESVVKWSISRCVQRSRQPQHKYTSRSKHAKQTTRHYAREYACVSTNNGVRRPSMGLLRS